MPRWTIVVFVGIVLSVAGGIVFFLIPESKPAPETVTNDEPSQNDASRPPAVPNAFGYLGPESCVACHAERVAEFRQTRHFQACVRPQANKMPVAFTDGRGEFVPADGPVRFVMSKSGNQYLQTAIVKTPVGEQRAVSPISLVYGLGAQTDEVYFTWQGTHLSELPMSWLHTINDWGTSGYDHAGQGDFSRPTTPRCMECHNTWMEHRPGTLNEYMPHNPMLGITCEVCHGPGREHVTYHEAHPHLRTAHGVIHPGTLSRDRRMDLCAQCHSNALKHKGPAFRYRPGLPLDQFYKTLTTNYPEEDHVANQVTYLHQSRCFQNSETMTCITCHNPHEARQMTGRGEGTSACLQCHQQDDCHERSRSARCCSGQLRRLPHAQR